MARTSAACAALAERTGTEARDWYPVFKARYGMREAFAALAGTRGDGEVVTQLFTCCTAVDPIVDCGLTPVYADVSAGTMSIDPDRLPARMGDATRAVMLQHTFGILDDASGRSLAGIARRGGALVAEDCAHCVGRLARDEAGAPLADLSFHSFGVEKILPTRFGGAVWVNPRLADEDPRLDGAIRGRLDALRAPGTRLDLVTRAYVNENRVLSRLGGLGGRMRKGMTRLGLYEPPIADVERAGGLAGPSYAPTAWIDRRAASAIRGLDANEERRRHVVALYRERLTPLASAGLEIPRGAGEGEPQPLLRMPLLAPDTATAERLIAAARSAGAYAERWYRPELFPGVTDPHAYGLDGLDRADVPVSGDLTRRILCLPTDLDGARVEATCDALAAELGA